MSGNTTLIIRFLLFAAVHSLFATAWLKKILHAAEHRTYRLCYNIASLAMFSWVMGAYRGSEVLYAIPGAAGLVLYLLQLIVLLILFSCLKQTGIGNFLGLSRISSSSFTCSGWYALVRHPLYFFSTLFMVLTPVMTSQWLLLTILGSAYFIAGGLIEERRLTEEFGEAYRRYQERVPFFIPNPARLWRHPLA